MPDDGAAQLHAALDVVKAAQRLRSHSRRNAHMFCRGNRRQGIELVVLATELPLHTANLAALLQHVKSMVFAHGGEVAHSGAECALLAPAALVQHAGQGFFQTVDDHAPDAGTVRTRWWNWRSIAARSGKMSA